MTRSCIALVALLSIAPASAWADQAQLDRSGSRLVVAGAVTLGAGVLLQVAGGLMLGLGANANDQSHGGVAVEITGIPVLALGAGATVAGAVMLGVGASRKHQSRKLGAQLSPLPSFTPLLAPDRRTIAGAATTWFLRF